MYNLILQYYKRKTTMNSSDIIKVDSKKIPSTFYFAILKKGGSNMARPKGTKNIMRPPEEKEKIVLFAKEHSLSEAERTFKIAKKTIQVWFKKYKNGGIEALKSKTGKHGYLNYKKPKTRLEELELENLKLKIEVSRLKKGYLLKGVGAKKEYVTIKNSNTK